MTTGATMEWAVENRRTPCGSPGLARTTADGRGTTVAVLHKQGATREPRGELTGTPSPQYPLLYDYYFFKDSPAGEGVAW